MQCSAMRVHPGPGYFVYAVYCPTRQVASRGTCALAPILLLVGKSKAEDQQIGRGIFKMQKQQQQAQKLVQVDALEILCNTLQYSVIICNTLLYSVILCNTLEIL